MRQGSKRPTATLVVLLLALSAGACGDGDRSGGNRLPSVPAEPAGEFEPRNHDDSGGGSGRLKAKGDGNSLHEFGKEASEREFKEAAAALHNFLDARAEGYWAAACEYMAKSVTQSFEKLASRSSRLEPGGCAAILGELTDPATVGALRKEAARADARSLRTDGRRAFLIYTGAAGEAMAFPMTGRNGRWRVAGIAAAPVG